MDVLPLRIVLDPSRASSFPVSSVRIPLEELEARVAELPPRGSEIRVAAEGKLLADTIQMLSRMGRFPIPAGLWETQDSPTPGRLWHVAGICERLQQMMKPGKAIDLGCGAGRNAVYLAANGWQITGYDHLPDALHLASHLALVHGVECDWRAANTDDPLWQPEETVDLVLCTYYWHENLFERAANWIMPGGILAIETFDSVHQQATGHPRNPARVLSATYSPRAWTELYRERIEGPNRNYMRLILERSSSTL